LMGNLPGMAYRCRNDPQWTLEFASEGAFALTGHRPDMLLSGAIQYGDLIHPDDRQRACDDVQRAVAADEPFELTYRITAANGKDKWGWAPGPHYLSRIRAGVQQMSDLTDAMLSLARLARVQLRWEPVDLAQAARDAVELLREQQPGRQLVLEIAQRLPAHGDPRLLAQVM